MDCELIISAERKAVELEISGDAQLHEKNAEVVAANEALDKCVHGEVTGATYAENVTQAVDDFGSIAQAINEKGVDVPKATAEYADVIRNEMSAGADINPAWTDWRYAYAYNRTDFLGKLKYGDTANGKNFYGMFFDSYRQTDIPFFDTGNGTTFTFMCRMCRALKSTHEFNLDNAITIEGMYYDCVALTEGKSIIAPNATTAKDLYYNCNLMVTAQDTDVHNATAVTRLYCNCVALVSIKSLNISSAQGATTHMFTSCRKLAEIRFEGEIPITISFQYSPLSPASVHSIVTHLKDHSGTDQAGVNTVTFKDGVFAPFEAEYPPPDGYASWTDYIQSIGWNISGG